MCAQVLRPLIPYRGTIPGGLHEGKIIEIKGSVPYGSDVFTVNLLTGLDVVGDRPLHLSVRFGGRVVVRNHFEWSAWGMEERHGPFPFAQGQPFTITITAEARGYRIAVNNQNCWEFNHRIPMIRVSSIFIDGVVQIESIGFVDRLGSYSRPPSAASFQFKDRGGSNLVPVYNPSIPYAYPIYGGLKPGMVIYISGRPSATAYRFTVNLQSGTSPHSPPDIAFHLDVRFFCQTVVRNSRTNDCWSREERDLPRFPFGPSVPFEVCVRVQRNRFALELDGRHLLAFSHRLHPLSRFDTLYLEGDLQVSSIRFA